MGVRIDGNYDDLVGTTQAIEKAANSLTSFRPSPESRVCVVKMDSRFRGNDGVPRATFMAMTDTTRLSRIPLTRPHLHTLYNIQMTE